jgi:putative transposase
MQKHYTEEQIIGFLREADAGTTVKDLCRKHGFSEPSYYAWKAKFGGMNVSDARRLKTLESEKTKLKKLLATRCSRSMPCVKCSAENSGRVGTSRGGQATAGSGGSVSARH